MATGVQSRPKSVLMFVARDWFVMDERISRTRSASGRKALFGMLNTIARAGIMPAVPSAPPSSALVPWSACVRLKMEL